MKRKIAAGLLVLALLICCLPSANAVTDPGQKIVYGYSGAGRELVAWRYGTGPNVMVLGFALHGWEDNWNRDGRALTWTAEQVMASLKSSNLAAERGWSVYVLPCMNPDGLEDGWTCNGPGRCTTSYFDDDGSLRRTWGIDMNRCFPTNFVPQYSDRNYTYNAPMLCKEARALAQFIASVKGTGTNILFDVHGWYQQTIVFSGQGGLLNTTVARHFPGNSYTPAGRASGYLITYAHAMGYDSCLLELPRGIYSLSDYKSSGNAARFVEVVNDLLRTKPAACANGHSYEETRVEPTCVKDGSSTKICKVCGDTVVTVLPATGSHSYTSHRTEPTCGKAGSIRYTCSVCNYTYSETLPATGNHTEALTHAEPTCTEAGLDTFTCTVCGNVRTQVIAALGHTPHEAAAILDHPATATRDGLMYGTCARCGLENLPFVLPRVFRDTKEAYYSDAVDAFYEMGFVTGVTSDRFAPHESLNRAALVTILYRCSGAPEYDNSELPFTDVKPTSWYASAVNWAYRTGVVNGMTETTFAPMDLATREQTAAIVYRYAEYMGIETLPSEAAQEFADWDTVRPYAQDPMNWCVSVGIMNGIGNNLLSPRATATRAQAVVLCWRAMDYFAENPPAPAEP